MAHSLEFEFLDDAAGGQFVPVGGPVIQVRGLLAKNELDAAVQLYEETRGAAREGLLVELTTCSFELKKAIAQMFRKARDFSSAAQAYEVLRFEAEAAAAWEQVNDFSKAGEAWKRAGELTKAAAAFERAGRTDDAVNLYGQAGSKESMAESLARAGRDHAKVLCG